MMTLVSTPSSMPRSTAPAATRQSHGRAGRAPPAPRKPGAHRPWEQRPRYSLLPDVVAALPFSDVGVTPSRLTLYGTFSGMSLILISALSKYSVSHLE